MVYHVAVVDQTVTSPARMRLGVGTVCMQRSSKANKTSERASSKLFSSCFQAKMAAGGFPEGVTLGSFTFLRGGDYCMEYQGTQFWLVAATKSVTTARPWHGPATGKL